MTKVPDTVFPFEGKFYKFAPEMNAGTCIGCALEAHSGDCLLKKCVTTPYIFKEVKEPKMSEPTEKVKLKGNKVTIRAGVGSGYVAGVDKLAVITDNGNGYTCKFIGHNSTQANIFVSLDYSQADYLFQALKAFGADRW